MEISTHILYEKKSNLLPNFLPFKEIKITTKKCMGHWWNFYVLDENVSCHCACLVCEKEGEKVVKSSFQECQEYHENKKDKQCLLAVIRLVP